VGGVGTRAGSWMGAARRAAHPRAPLRRRRRHLAGARDPRDAAPRPGRARAVAVLAQAVRGALWAARRAVNAEKRRRSSSPELMDPEDIGLTAPSTASRSMSLSSAADAGKATLAPWDDLSLPSPAAAAAAAPPAAHGGPAPADADYRCAAPAPRRAGPLPPRAPARPRRRPIRGGAAPLIGLRVRGAPGAAPPAPAAASRARAAAAPPGRLDLGHPGSQGVNRPSPRAVGRHSGPAQQRP
jgi:hypothetical protein